MTDLVCETFLVMDLVENGWMVINKKRKGVYLQRKDKLPRPMPMSQYLSIEVQYYQIEAKI